MPASNSKDNFSGHAAQYALFRPVYPKALFNWLFKQCESNTYAWDCGTGNGQVASQLIPYFQKVFASDISENQLEQAKQNPSIVYKIESSSSCSAPNESFDLIVVAQAIHWFNFVDFYSEVNRTLKPSGLLAVIGYHLPTIDAENDKLINFFYKLTLEKYWDKERKYIDEKYQTIPFPFQKISCPAFTMQTEWNLNQLIGYLGTWSAVQHYIRTNHTNPLLALEKDLALLWKKDEIKKITFQLFLRVGKK